MAEIDYNDDAFFALQNRIKAPLSWPSPPFAKIVDLREDHYDDVTHLIKHHYFKDDPTCKTLAIQDDKASLKGYLNLVRVWMKDTTSVVALSSISGRVIGAAISRINSNLDRTNTYSRIQIFQGNVLEKIMHLKSQLVKQSDAYSFFNVTETFRVYILCCHPSYQNRGLESALLETCIYIASVLGISAIVGVFTSGFTQSVAAKLGFQTLSEILYSQWIINDKIVFPDPGIGNFSIAFMGMVVPESDEVRLRQSARRLQYEKMPLKNCYQRV